MLSPFAALPPFQDNERVKKGILVALSGYVAGALLGGFSALASGDPQSAVAVAQVCGVETSATATFLYMLWPKTHQQAPEVKCKTMPLPDLAF